MVGVKRLIREARNTDAPLCPTDKTAEELAEADAKNTNNSAENNTPVESAIGQEMETESQNNGQSAELASDAPAVLPVDTQQVILNSAEGPRVIEAGNVTEQNMDTENSAAASDNTCDNAVS